MQVSRYRQGKLVKQVGQCSASRFIRFCVARLHTASKQKQPQHARRQAGRQAYQSRHSRYRVPCGACRGRYPCGTVLRTWRAPSFQSVSSARRVGWVRCVVRCSVRCCWSGDGGVWEEGGSDATGGATGNREGRGRPKQRGAKGKPGQPYL